MQRRPEDELREREAVVMLEHGFSELNLKVSKDVVVALDASESAGAYQDEICRVALQLIENQHSYTTISLFFLGNPEAYDARELKRNAKTWWQQNRSRGSFIRPIMERMPASDVVVIGSGAVYDLDDWWETDPGSTIYLMKVGATLRGESRFGEEEEMDDMFQLLTCLHNPIVRVEIAGDGFMPYYWSNAAYKLVMAEAKPVRLLVSDCEDPSICVGCFGNNVRARVVRSKGEELRSLSPADCSASDDWVTLTERECLVFRQVVRDEKALCPACGVLHSMSGLRCRPRDGALLGEPIYPSIRGGKGFVFFKEISGAVAYRFHPVNAVKIGDRAVAVASGSRATIYEYEESQNKWVGQGPLKPYHPLGSEYLAVL